MAIASIITPKKYFTAFIQPPARGSRAPADTPTSSSGTPMPSASTNSATPPSVVLPVCAMKASAAASGGATQGPTMTADSTPMANTPTKLPPFILLEASENLLWMKLGSCKFEEAEHRQGQRHEDAAHRCRAPTDSAARWKQGAGQRRRHAGQRVGDRHAQHIGERKQEAAAVWSCFGFDSARR